MSSLQTNLWVQHHFLTLTQLKSTSLCWFPLAQEHDDTPTASLLNLEPTESILEVRCNFLHAPAEPADLYLKSWIECSPSAESMITALIPCGLQVSPATQRRIRASLSDLDNEEAIENLSVRQLKEILARNFVNYSGCCEKWELLERVHRLYRENEQNRKSSKHSSFLYLFLHQKIPCCDLWWYAWLIIFLSFLFLFL